MCAVIAGFLAGAASGIIMGVLSHLLFKLHVFKSSLIIIDGTFLFRTLGKHPAPGVLAITGLIIHLITSAVFGAIYFIATGILGISAQTAAWSFFLIGLYITLLWLSMLFIALPIAGEGFFGKRSGNSSWFEQLVLHAIFFIAYVTIVRMLV